MSLMSEIAKYSETSNEDDAITRLMYRPAKRLFQSYMNEKHSPVQDSTSHYQDYYDGDKHILSHAKTINTRQSDIKWIGLEVGTRGRRAEYLCNDVLLGQIQTR